MLTAKGGILPECWVRLAWMTRTAPPPCHNGSRLSWKIRAGVDEIVDLAARM
jgi:hypothetical protein